jgi:type IV secretory pathway TraG/TraD family ATPase VirD4
VTHVLGPSVGAGRDITLPLGLVAACWTPVAVGGLIWVAGHLASLTSGSGWRGPAFDAASGGVLLEDGPQALWPQVPTELVWTYSAVLLALALTPVVALSRAVLTRRSSSAEQSLATELDVAPLLPDGVARRAEHLRRSLKPNRRRSRRPAREDGVLLGRLRTARGARLEVRASWEDVVLAVMAPRAGKTTALAVPAVLDAPGPVVATSNKPDLWATCAKRRAAESGERAWVFDPQGITGVERTWWWDPLRGMKTVEGAHRLAGHFVQEVRGSKGHRDFWTSAAHDLLTGLLLAAGLGGRSLVEVYEWLNDPVITTPAQILRDRGQEAAAASLVGRQNGAPETRDGIYETARTAARCLRDPRIMAWVVRDGARPELVAESFVHTREALYLLSKDGAGAAAPLVAALTDSVMTVATNAAERAGGRLDPPMVVVLDEAANVCRIADLPELYSHLGSRGVLPLTILQSYRQGARVWGDHGMDALWSASTCKLLGAGLDDARFAEDVSRLIGDHDVTVRSLSRGSGHASESTSLRRQRILPPEAIRALPRGRALLLATGARAAMIDLQPWYRTRRDS